MNTDNNGRLIIPVWVWATTAVALVAIFGAIMWASLASPEKRIDANETAMVPPEGQPMGAGPDPGHATAPSVPPPYTGRSAPKVTVTEVEPLGVPDSALDVSPQPPPASPKPKPKPAAKNPGNDVTDMFPVGPVAPKPPPARAAKQPAPKPSEDFPGFGYAGRQWEFTGQFASAGQVDLSATDADAGGKPVYALSNSGDQRKVLFVQSDTDPGKYAIYRSAG